MEHYAFVARQHRQEPLEGLVERLSGEVDSSLDEGRLEIGPADVDDEDGSLREEGGVELLHAHEGRLGEGTGEEGVPGYFCYDGGHNEMKEAGGRRQKSGVGS